MQWKVFASKKGRATFDISNLDFNELLIKLEVPEAYMYCFTLHIFREELGDARKLFFTGFGWGSSNNQVGVGGTLTTIDAGSQILFGTDRSANTIVHVYYR